MSDFTILEHIKDNVVWPKSLAYAFLSQSEGIDN